MHVTTNGNWRLYELGVGLVAEDLFGLLHNKLDLFLCYGFERSDVFYYQVEVLVVLAHFITCEVDWIELICDWLI